MKSRIVIICGMAVFVLMLIVIGSVLLDKSNLSKTDGDGRQPDIDERNNTGTKTMHETPTGEVDTKHLLSIPDGITKIKILDGNKFDSITLEGEEELQRFIKALNSIAGVATIVEPSVGFQYGVQFYCEDAMCGGLSFMTETVVREDKGVDEQWRITYDVPHPAFAFIEEAFAKWRQEK